MAVALLIAITGVPAWGAKEAAPPADVATVAASGGAFGVDLYGKLAAGEGNVLFSPLSLHAALAMTWAGAGGQTADEMAKVLHLALPKDRVGRAYGAVIGTLAEGGEAGEGEEKKPYSLYLASSLWKQKGLKTEDAFTQSLRSNYLASMFETDFAKPEAARATINDWVGGFTEHKIKDLVPAGVLTLRTRVLLANAIYFKSNWKSPFSKGRTHDGPFRVSADKTVTVPMMAKKEDRDYLETAEFQAIELGYANWVQSMVIFLPKKVDGLAAFEKSLTADALAGWLKKLKSADVDLKLPRFQAATAMRLAPALQALGMKNAFSRAADFTGIAETAEGLLLSDVVHSTMISVDEYGTEAAAASAAVFALADGGEPQTVTVDHPFFFVIRDAKSGAMLFMGRVVDPKGSDERP
jgi:serpin B